jgi:hypothetical protein
VTEFVQVEMFGGPLDGHSVPWPSPLLPLHCIPTWNGVWVGDLLDGLPDDLSDGEYAPHNYALRGDGVTAPYRYDYVGSISST